jgi:hypothetical protein
MSNRSWLIWGISFSIILLLLLWDLRRKRRVATDQLAIKYSWLSLALVLLIAISVMIVANYQPLEQKGADNPISWNMVAGLFLAMVAGMLAQHFFYSANWRDYAAMIRPFFASPIVFIPLASSYQSSLSSAAAFSFADFMILLVAFQNGFFWKAVFEKQSAPREGTAVQ